MGWAALIGSGILVVAGGFVDGYNNCFPHLDGMELIKAGLVYLGVAAGAYSHGRQENAGS